MYFVSVSVPSPGAPHERSALLACALFLTAKLDQGGAKLQVSATVFGTLAKPELSGAGTVTTPVSASGTGEVILRVGGSSVSR